jgi:hypothetical protein
VHPVTHWIGDSNESVSCSEDQLPPQIYPPVPAPAPSVGDVYAGDPAANYADPYAYDPGAYDTDAYAIGYADGKVDHPYYDADPVQFAYTPSDIPSRPAVVRPERTTLISLIVPRVARQPLYELVEVQPPPDAAPNLTAPSERHLSWWQL